MSPESDYFNLTHALKHRAPFKIAACLGSNEARMQIKDGLISKALLHIVDPSLLISDFWRGDLDFNHAVASLYHIYHMHDIYEIKRAIQQAYNQFGAELISQSSIIKCIIELIDLCESQSQNSGKTTIRWSFTDWWGMENLKYSIINIAFENISDINYVFCMPNEADIIVYNVYTYYHQLYSRDVKRFFWTNEHDFVDITYAHLSLAPSNIFDISPHIRYPGWYSSIPIGTVPFYKNKFASIELDQLATNSIVSDMKDREYDASIIISNPVANRIQFVELLENHGLKVNKAGRAYNRPVESKAKILKTSKFNICFENTVIPGYVTEKLPDAKLNGCIPLYWGPAEANIDFNKKSFFNLAQVSNIDKFISKIVEISRNDVYFNSMLSERLFINKPNIKDYLERVCKVMHSKSI